MNATEAFDKLMTIVETQQRTIEKLIQIGQMNTACIEKLEARVKFLEVVGPSQ